MKKFIFILLIIVPNISWGIELLLPGQTLPGKVVYFDIPTASRILEEVEICRDSMEELKTYRELDAVQQAMDKVRDERETLLRERIAFLEKQNEELYKLNDLAIKTAEKMSKGPSISDRIFNATGWMGVGILLIKILGIVL